MRAWLAIAVCAACSVPEVQYQPLVRELVVEQPVTLNRQLDMLFVIDDSPGMDEKQLNLANSFPALVNQLNLVEGGLPDLHLGVVTTDMGTKSSLDAPAPQVGPQCISNGKNGNLQTNGSTVITGTFISDIRLGDGTRQTNYTGALAGAFASIAKPGANGCGFEQPLAAMKAALANNPANAGFVRTGAHLAVIFLTDEDDCSAKHAELFDPNAPDLGPINSFRCTRFGVTCDTGGTNPDEMATFGDKADCHAASDSMIIEDVSTFHTFLTSFKPDPKDVMVAAIEGDLQPFAVQANQTDGSAQLAHSCVFDGPQTADPAVRMQEFLDLFPDRSHGGSICQTDLTSELEAIGQLALRTIGSPCVFAKLTDTDPNTPGLQEDCFVEDVVGGQATTIDRCGSPPCWHLDVDPTTCPAGAHLKLVVDRGTMQPPAAAVTKMQCRIDQ